MKIRTKILLYFALPIFLAGGAITFVNGYSNYNTIKSLAEAKFVSDTDAIAAKISRENTRGMAVSKCAASAAEILFGNRPESTRLIRNLLIEFPSFIGGSVGYTVNADFNDSRTDTGLKNLRDGKDAYANGGIDAYELMSNRTSTSIDEWIAKCEGGRYLTYWMRKNDELFIEPLVDMDVSMYSAGLRKKLESGDKESFIVTEPYLYNNKVLMVEYSSPIIYDGKFSGQTAFDTDLSNLSMMLSSLKTLDGEEMFLISSQARIISSTKYDNLKTVSIDDLYTDENGNFIVSFLRDENGQLVRDEKLASKMDFSRAKTVYRDLLKSAFNAAKNSTLIDNSEKKVIYFKDPQTRKSYCVSYALIRPGNWVLVHSIPESVILASVTKYIYGNLAGFILFISIVAAIMVFSKRFLKRVAMATNIAEEISRGNLRMPMPSTANMSNDETGRLVRSMTHMVRKLSAMLRGMKDSEQMLYDTANNIEKASLNYEHSIHGVADSSDSIRSAAKYITDTEEELCKSSETLRDASAETAELAEMGRKNLGAMEGAMSELSKSTVVVARRLSIINERANNINSVITTISKVADETNLLSFNASIEAEKAGAYGVGFAVVAREIGRLAEQTAGATADIETIVRDVQSAVAAGVSEMDKFSEQMSANVADVDVMLSAMDSIITRMQTIVPEIDHLNSEMQSQRENVGRINDAILSLGDNIRRASGLLREVSASRAQLREAVKKIASDMSGFSFDRGDFHGS